MGVFTYVRAAGCDQLRELLHDFHGEFSWLPQHPARLRDEEAKIHPSHLREHVLIVGVRVK